MNRFESGSSAVGAMALPALLQPLPFNKREMWPLLPVVVAHLVDQLLPTPEIRGLNLIISKFYLLSTVL